MRFVCVFAICAVLIGGSSSFHVNSLKKCAVKDSECLRNMYQNLLISIGKTGISEVGLPPLDPLKLKDISVSLLGLVDLTLVDGEVLGISGCVFDKYTFELEQGTAHQENTCSITMQGQYKIKSNAIIDTFLGDNGLHGEGNAVFKFDNVHMIFDYLVYAQKRDDGEIYLNVDYDNVKHNIEFLDKAEFKLDQFYIGDQETSQTLIPFVNQNWKLINKIGMPFGDKAAEVYLDMIRKFFDKVPMKYFITDDLSSIAKP